MLLDIDECSNGSHDCDVNANCTNTNGSHSCTCKEGYTGKGESCQGKIRLYFKKKQNNCSSQIIALLSNKLAEEFFLYSVTHCESIVFTDVNECNDDVCDANANCTNTNGSQNCICKEGNIRGGQSCQCRLELRYFMSSKAAFHNKYCLRNWANDQEATQWFSRPDLVFQSSYGYHNMHRYKIFAGLKYNTCGYFTSSLECFRA